MTQQALFDVPNLDALSVDSADYDLAADVLGQLAAYAHAKARAMRLRVQGDVEAALSWEKHQEALYRKLPQWARW
jgi:hypothetical protein